MNNPFTREKLMAFLKSDYSKLILILGFAFYIAFIPNQTYPYPVHIDEWVHIAHADEVLEHGSVINLPMPFNGETRPFIDEMELGFQTFLGVTQRITGIPWVDIFRFFPSIIFMLTVLAAYVAARREGFGLGAAFMTCFIITTVGIMGPGFLVPVAMALFFIPLLIYLAFNYKTVWSYLASFLLMTFLITIHGPSAIVGVLILLPFVLLKLKKEPKHSLLVLLAVIAPFLLSLPVTHTLALQYVKELLQLPGWVSSEESLAAYHDLPKIFWDYGILPSSLCLMGTFILGFKGGARNYALVLGTLAVLVLLAAYFSASYGIGIIYLRAILFAMLMMGIVGGAGLKAVWDLKLPEAIAARLRLSRVSRFIGPALCLVLVGVTLGVTIPEREKEPYYHMINSTDFDTFTWIKENLPQHTKAVLEPWKATAFVAVTGKHVYVRQHMGPNKTTNMVYDYIEGSSNSTDFLINNGITIVYTRIGSTSYPPNNPDLVEVYPDVYILKTE